MKFPSPRQFVEVRRALPVIAAVLLVVSIFLPMWEIDVHAVQYPNEVLSLHLYAYPHISGDYWEMAELNQYVGFYYPDPVYWEPNYEVHPKAIEVPEWVLGPFVLLGLAAVGLFVSIAPTNRKLKLGLKGQLFGTIGLLVVRLYQAGHTLDPDAPLIGVDEFTPPIWGRYEVANITSYSSLDVGAYVIVVAIMLIVLAFRYRNTDATLVELPRLLVKDIRSIPTKIPVIGRKSGG
ncbi:MAG: hypothetical protein SXQ77_11135 [Halobacteria archaeon]|nr:hypothetical protein [Halobacteria archaeon]